MSRGLRAAKLPITRAKTPARIKRRPAYNICEKVSSDAICENLQPSFMQGKALPHSRQQSIASKKTTALFFSNSLFFIKCSFNKPAGPFCFVQKLTAWLVHSTEALCGTYDRLALAHYFKCFPVTLLRDRLESPFCDEFCRKS